MDSSRDTKASERGKLTGVVDKPGFAKIANDAEHEQHAGDCQFGSPTPPPVIQLPRIKQKGVPLPVKAVKQIHELYKDRDVGNEEKAERSLKEESIIEAKTEETEMPDRYNMLAEFFDKLDTSIRLLRLRKKPSTFNNISIQVEVLTKRKFLCKHLAQILYIYPEAIKIEKILKHDEVSLCMKPELKIALLPDVVNVKRDESPHMALCQNFRSRIVNFLRTHPEDDDIPEALLPEPFNRRDAANMTQVLPLEPSMISPGSTSELESLGISSHVSPSFVEHFSKKTLVLKEDTKSPEKNKVSASPLTSSKASLELPCSPKQCFDYNSSGATPSKVLLTPLTETPVQLTPQRPFSSPADCTYSSNDTSSNSITKRALNFSAPASESDMSGPAEDIDKNTGDKNEVEIVDDCEMNQKDLDKSQLKFDCLLDLCIVIQLVFQKSNYLPVTKEELVHKILWHSDNIEIEELEDQLEFLEELLPEWISRKQTPCCDMYSIVKTLDMEFIRARLEEAL